MLCFLFWRLRPTVSAFEQYFDRLDTNVRFCRWFADISAEHAEAKFVVLARERLYLRYRNWVSHLPYTLGYRKWPTRDIPCQVPFFLRSMPLLFCRLFLANRSNSFSGIPAAAAFSIAAAISNRLASRAFW